ncbi:hypothetical protein C9374_013657 [Naegleria lovaniensis]|uniref:Uncharacterized protein n=1 Tax=Naegleria lovaniensis TaxID=51637 RepID=A0AA88GBP3_NAELO|nr:uncharacterized protein C9374_013657 [Naegleria lovaniensis]KAG2372702.1 hypothetical protein C9374_013657 [Naegleria lovaniensis]
MFNFFFQRKPTPARNVVAVDPFGGALSLIISFLDQKTFLSFAGVCSYIRDFIQSTEVTKAFDSNLKNTDTDCLAMRQLNFKKVSFHKLFTELSFTKVSVSKNQMAILLASNKVDTLVFKHSQLTFSDITSTISNLVFESVSINAITINKIGNVFNNIKHLSFKHVGFNWKLMESFLKLKFKCLESLYFRDDQLDTDCANIFLMSSNFKTLKSIAFKHCSIQHISKIDRNNFPHLEKFSFTTVFIDDAIIINILESQLDLKELYVNAHITLSEKIALSLLKNPKLSIVKLHSYARSGATRISDDVFLLLMSGLKYLTEISLQIPSRLMPILTANTNVRLIRINMVDIEKDPSLIQSPLLNFRFQSMLQVLDLSHCLLRDLDCAAISSSNIKELSIICCSFVDNGYSSLAHMTQLKTLVLCYPRLLGSAFDTFFCGSLISLENFEFSPSSRETNSTEDCINVPKLTFFKSSHPTRFDIEKILRNSRIVTLDLSEWGGTLSRYVDFEFIHHLLTTNKHSISQLILPSKTKEKKDKYLTQSLKLQKQFNIQVSFK